MSLPISVNSAAVGKGGRAANSRHRPQSVTPINPRPSTRAYQPYDRPLPDAARISSGSPHRVRAVSTIAANPRVRLLAPNKTMRRVGSGRSDGAIVDIVSENLPISTAGTALLEGLEAGK